MTILGLLYGNDAGFDVCLDFHMRILLFELDDRAMTIIAAPSAPMSAIIASHQERRERTAELIMAARIFSGRRRVGRAPHRRFAAG